jgi:serine/threonine-protein kinase
VFAEAQAASALNHPNIVTVHEMGVNECMDYIVMEYVDGKTLAQVIADGPAELVDVRHWMAQLCEGLAAAHEEGIVHRDIKPGNLMVTRRGRLKILDFGLACREGKDGDGRVAGTAAYMSPEQARGHAATAASDVFAAGAVLFELLTGVRAFRGESVMSVIGAILYVDPMQERNGLKNLSAGVRDVLRKALAKDSSGRYRDGGEFGSALAAVEWEDRWSRAMLELVGLLRKR